MWSPDTGTPIAGMVGKKTQEATGRPVAVVLRDGVLGIDGLERRTYEPDQVPTATRSPSRRASRLKYSSQWVSLLPSFALTSDGAAAAMASELRSAGA